VCLLAASYHHVITTLESAIGAFDGKERSAVFAGNARRIYGLPVPAGRPAAM
jgi:hypothetical protein